MDDTYEDDTYESEYDDALPADDLREMDYTAELWLDAEDDARYAEIETETHRG